MDDGRNFFNNIARGDSPDEGEKIIDQEFIDDSGESIEPTLVKSGSSAVELRTNKSRSAKRNSDEYETSSEEDAVFEDSDGQLAIDIYQTPDEIVIQSTIAGVKIDDLDIHITNEAVSIRGVRHKEDNIRDEDYYYQECYWGRFSRSIILPQEIDSDKATAELKSGVLTIAELKGLPVIEDKFVSFSVPDNLDPYSQYLLTLQWGNINPDSTVLVRVVK